MAEKEVNSPIRTGERGEGRREDSAIGPVSPSPGQANEVKFRKSAAKQIFSEGEEENPLLPKEEEAGHRGADGVSVSENHLKIDEEGSESEAESDEVSDAGLPARYTWKTYSGRTEDSGEDETDEIRGACTDNFGRTVGFLYILLVIVGLPKYLGGKGAQWRWDTEFLDVIVFLVGISFWPREQSSVKSRGPSVQLKTDSEANSKKMNGKVDGNWKLVHPEQDAARCSDESEMQRGTKNEHETERVTLTHSISSAPQTKRRKYYIDNIRFWVIFCVVTFHGSVTFGGVKTSGPLFLGLTKHNLLRPILLSLSAPGLWLMPLMFFISGYFGIASYEKKLNPESKVSRGGVHAYFVDNVVRIGLPIWIYAFVIQPIKGYVVFHGIWATGLASHRFVGTGGPAEAVTAQARLGFDPTLKYQHIPYSYDFSLSCSINTSINDTSTRV